MDEINGEYLFTEIQTKPLAKEENQTPQDIKLASHELVPISDVIKLAAIERKKLGRPRKQKESIDRQKFLDGIAKGMSRTDAILAAGSTAKRRNAAKMARKVIDLETQKVMVGQESTFAERLHTTLGKVQAAIETKDLSEEQFRDLMAGMDTITKIAERMGVMQKSFEESLAGMSYEELVAREKLQSLQSLRGLVGEAKFFQILDLCGMTPEEYTAEGLKFPTKTVAKKTEEKIDLDNTI